jgi:Ca2+-dependent lipid-binding protein
MAGQLSVTIVEAKQLRDEDTVGGANDAFVEVYLDDDYKQRTATIPNSNSPQWNETFQL